MRTFVLVVLLCCTTSLAAAQMPPRGDFGCTKPLALCTQERVVQLRALSRSLLAAAAIPPPARLTPEQRRTAGEYDDWLRARSKDALDLAALGAQARAMQEMNISFNLQYLELQQKMQTENRKFTMLSNVMKTKRDTAKNAIGNVR